MSHARPLVFVPAVVIGGVDGAVGEVGPGAELRQTLGVQQRPGAALVGGKLQTHTENTTGEILRVVFTPEITLISCSSVTSLSGKHRHRVSVRSSVKQDQILLSGTVCVNILGT